MREDSIHAEEYKGYIIRVFPDTDPSSPRDWDNLGTMVCFHGRYTLGDKGHGYRVEDQGSWKELEEKLRADGAEVILPLYLYDHSGITIRTTPFSCPWDSGQVGFIFVTKEKLEKEFGTKVTAKRIEDATRVLNGEVEEYDNYITGNVYGYTIEGPEGDKDSCWGFFGDYDDKEYGALAEAKSVVDHIVARDFKARMETDLQRTGMEE